MMADAENEALILEGVLQKRRAGKVNVLSVGVLLLCKHQQIVAQQQEKCCAGQAVGSAVVCADSQKPTVLQQQGDLRLGFASKTPQHSGPSSL